MQILAAIHTLDRQAIKGLGPAAANLLYFLHPTIVPPTNTAIVNGYNALTGAKVRLGRWDEYLAMRQGVLKLNDDYRPFLSNDLGAIAGLLFDIGSERYPAPPNPNDLSALARWQDDLRRIREQASQATKAQRESEADERTHTEVQGWLRDLGLALGFSVWVAGNDRNRSYRDGRLGDGCLDCLPRIHEESSAFDAVRLIDILWLDRSSDQVTAAFEVEHTTSIYSGIVRMLDLALGHANQTAHSLFLVAPDKREADVRAQLLRPAFSRVSDLKLRYLAYSDLETHKEAIARFGSGMKGIEAIARSLT